MATLTPAFQTAVTDSKKLTSKPGNDDLLELYGSSEIRGLLYFARILINIHIALYKIGTGEDITKATQPGMFDLKVSPPTDPHTDTTRRI